VQTWYVPCSTAEYEVTGTFSDTVLQGCTAGQTYKIPLSDIDPDGKIVEADTTSFTVSPCSVNDPLVFNTGTLCSSNRSARVFCIGSLLPAHEASCDTLSSF
jgi:hypothetical protein